MRCLGCLLSAVLLLSLCASASDGNELIGIGAVQTGTAGAGIAEPQDSTWALLNPASIVALEKRLCISAEFLDLFRANEPHGVPLVVNQFAGHNVDAGTVFVPSVGMILPLQVGTLGFGMFGVQGNNADYDHSRAGVLFARGNDRRSELQVAKIPLAYGYEFDNGLAIGASIIGVVTTFRTDSLTLRLMPTEGSYKREIGLGIGVQFGVQKEWDRFALAASWTSRQAVEQYDHYEDAIRQNLDLPEKFQAGFSWDVTERLTLVADYKFQRWSAIDQYAKPTIRGGLGWEDQHIYKAGAIFRLNDNWILRGGFSTGNAPVTEEFVFANALSPAIAEDQFTLGFTRKLSENSDLHFAWNHTFDESLTDSGKGDLFSKLGRGTKIEYEEDGFTFQYSYRF